MPFKSDSQRRLCYLLKGKGRAGSWDCDEWSTATGKKNLPEHVEDQIEKEASGLSAVKALCALWSIPSPLKEAAAKSLLSKLSSVITSPGRGSGDEEETAINPDSSEGLQMAKSTKPVPRMMSLNQKGLKPVAPLGAARNAVRRGTQNAFGFDPANKVLSKEASNFDFSSIGAKLDPSLISGPKQAPSIQGVAPARGFDFANMTKSLQNTGRQVGEAATSEVEKWVKAPGWTSPIEVLKRRNQALGAQKAMGQVTDSAGKVINLGKNFLSAGSTLMGMGKQSSTQSTTGGSAIAPKAAVPSAPAAISPKIAAPKAAVPSAPSNNGNALSGAASGVGDAFRAGFGNQDAFKRVQDDLNRPNYSQLNNTINGFSDAFGGVGKQMQGAYGAAKTLFRPPPPNPNPGFFEKAEVQAVEALNKGRLAISVASDPEGWRRASQTADWAKRLGSGLSNSYNTAKSEAANSEGRRMAAGATMPVLNFMQNNPWAKYLVGALGTGAVGYGLNSMFGDQQKQQSQAGSVFQQSYNQGLKGS